MEFDVLRGDDTQSGIMLSGNIGNAVCTNNASGTFDISGLCGGRSGLINTKNIVVMNLRPNPTSGQLTLSIIAPSSRSTLNIRTLFGEIISTHQVLMENTIIDVSALATGIYYCELLTESGELIIQPITIIR